MQRSVTAALTASPAGVNDSFLLISLVSLMMKKRSRKLRDDTFMGLDPSSLLRRTFMSLSINIWQSVWIPAAGVQSVPQLVSLSLHVPTSPCMVWCVRTSHRLQSVWIYNLILAPRGHRLPMSGEMFDFGRALPSVSTTWLWRRVGGRRHWQLSVS